MEELLDQTLQPIRAYFLTYEICSHNLKKHDQGAINQVDLASMLKVEGARLVREME